MSIDYKYDHLLHLSSGVVSNEDQEVSAIVSQSSEAVSPTDTHESMDISHASSYSSERSETDTITRRKN